MGSGHDANILGSSQPGHGRGMAVAVGVGRKAGRQGGTEDNAFVGSSLQEAP